MAYELSISQKQDRTCEMRDMDRGDIAEIIDVNCAFRGFIVLRTSDEFVALNRPITTWDGQPTLAVRKLPPGTVVTLTVK